MIADFHTKHPALKRDAFFVTRINKIFKELEG
jgi:hypothetical protein